MDNIYINKVLSGNIDAFKYFVSTYKHFAFSLSFSILKNDYLAEEAVQESFIKTFDKLNTFKENAKFKTWFARIVINESLIKVRENTIRYKESDISEQEIEDVENSLNNLLSDERKFYISEVFSKLPYQESLVLELFYLQDFSIKEICSITNWSMSKVKMLNLRGRKNFYEKLKEMLNLEAKEIV